MTHTPKRLLRILLAGGILATAWVAVDLMTSSDSASAAESVEVVPDTVISDTVSAVTPPLVMAPVTPIVQAVTETSVPVVAPVASTIAPIAAPIVAPVVTSAIEPLEPAVTVLTEPLAPVAHAVLEPVVPVIVPLLPVVADVVAALPLAAVTPNAPLLTGGMALLGAAVAASVAPLLPLPGRSPSPARAPESPNAATAFSPVLYADVAFSLPADVGRSLSATAKAEPIPASPTFASDTTPD